MYSWLIKDIHFVWLDVLAVLAINSMNIFLKNRNILYIILNHEILVDV